MSVPIHSNVPPVTGRIDFGWIGQAWALFSAQAGVWVGAIVLSLLIDAGLWVLLAFPFGVIASMRHAFSAVLTHTPPPVAANPYLEFVQMQVLYLLLGCVIAIFNGGLYRMALRQKRGETISVSGLFSAFPQGLSLVIIGSCPSIVLSLFEGICLWLLHFSLQPTPAIAVMNQVILVVALVPNGLLMFAPLLVLDTGTNAAEAFLGSILLLRGQLLRGIFFYAVITLVSGIGFLLFGFLLCGVGLLVTLPLSFLGIAVGYLALTQPAADSTPAFDTAPVGVWPPPPRTP